VKRKKAVNNSNHSEKKATPGPKAGQIEAQGKLERPCEEVSVQKETSRRLAKVGEQL
jgi:hypothetical protein